MRMGYYEKEYWLKKEGYFLITPVLQGETLAWHLVDGEEERDVTLSGNNPSDSLGDEIVNARPETRPIDKLFRNYFVAKGSFTVKKPVVHRGLVVMRAIYQVSQHKQI